LVPNALDSPLAERLGNTRVQEFSYPSPSLQAHYKRKYEVHCYSNLVLESYWLISAVCSHPTDVQWMNEDLQNSCDKLCAVTQSEDIVRSRRRFLLSHIVVYVLVTVVYYPWPYATEMGLS